ncbi:hypothetical protein RYX36_027492 [Vicia faba]
MVETRVQRTEQSALKFDLSSIQSRVIKKRKIDVGRSLTVISAHAPSKHPQQSSPKRVKPLMGDPMSKADLNMIILIQEIGGSPNRPSGGFDQAADRDDQEEGGRHATIASLIQDVEQSRESTEKLKQSLKDAQVDLLAAGDKAFERENVETLCLQPSLNVAEMDYLKFVVDERLLEMDAGTHKGDVDDKGEAEKEQLNRIQDENQPDV